MQLIKILILAFTWMCVSSLRIESAQSVEHDDCQIKSSCATCIRKSQCAWCITKSKCTKQSCGNDNVIYPPNIYALMSGPQFCPSIVQPQEILTLKSGNNESIIVPITQIHLYMAYTEWKCRIRIGEFDETVPALLVNARVRCGPVLLSIEFNEPYLNGSVTVMWDNNKNFDGTFPFKLCRCDLDLTCSICKKDN